MKDSFEAARYCAIADGRYFRGDSFIGEFATRCSQEGPFAVTGWTNIG